MHEKLVIVGGVPADRAPLPKRSVSIPTWTRP
jgi:hypothetical protein